MSSHEGREHWPAVRDLVKNTCKKTPSLVLLHWCELNCNKLLNLSHFGKIHACLENSSLFWALSSPYIHKYFILVPTVSCWDHIYRNEDRKGTQASLFSVISLGFVLLHTTFFVTVTKDVTSCHEVTLLCLEQSALSSSKLGSRWEGRWGCQPPEVPGTRWLCPRLPGDSSAGAAAPSAGTGLRVLVQRKENLERGLLPKRWTLSLPCIPLLCQPLCVLWK